MDIRGILRLIIFTTIIFDINLESSQDFFLLILVDFDGFSQFCHFLIRKILTKKQT